VRSGLVTTDSAPVLAAGVGLRHRSAWLLRSVSFRVDIRPQDGLVLGIATGQQATASAVVNLLAGLARPSHGELRVLGKDLTTAAGRAAVRRQVGIARIPGRPESVFRSRGLAEHAARLARIPDRDRAGRAAAILDRLALMPWAEVRLSAAPARSPTGLSWPPPPCTGPDYCFSTASWTDWPRGSGPAWPPGYANWPGTPSSSRPGTMPPP